VRLLYPREAEPSVLEHTAIWKGDEAQPLPALCRLSSGYYELAQIGIECGSKTPATRRSIALDARAAFDLGVARSCLRPHSFAERHQRPVACAST